MTRNKAFHFLMFSNWLCSLCDICFLIACGGYSLHITADRLYLKW